MLQIKMQPQAFANLRFAYSPLLELTISFRVLRSSWASALYWRWIEEASQATHDLELPYMSSLICQGVAQGVKCSGYIPDFITPTPLYPVSDIEDDFERMLNMPDDLIRDGIQTLIGLTGESDLLCDFLAYPQAGVQNLVAEMREYWQRTLAQHWGRMVTVLENDILHHSRTLTLHGLESLFPDVDPILSYTNNTILLDYAQSRNMPPSGVRKQTEYSLASDSFHLAPVVFGGNMVLHQLIEPWNPMLLYTPRGAGLWNYEQPEPSEALELTLGAGKARVLMALVDPLSTGELAHKLSLTAGAVSQQLGKLHQAGLVESHRSGKNVFYRLTVRGNQLVELFS